MNALEIKDFRKRNGLSQQDLAEIVKSSLSSVRSWEQNQRNVTQSAIELMKIYEQSEIGSELKEKKYSSTVAVKVVTTKARAGFTDSYYSDEYLEDLPTVLIESDKEYKGKYLAFEVDGDSMEPDYNVGDIVICREVQRSLWQYKLHYKDYDFVIAHGTQGIMLKEIRDHNPETGEIVCHSLNENNKDFTLNLKEVAFLYNVVEHRISGKSKRRNR